MAQAHRQAWANPSSLHGFGLAAADRLERDRLAIAGQLGCDRDELVLLSGGSEAIHTALIGCAGCLEPGRMLLSAVEHPASYAAAAAMERRGWQRQLLPVDGRGLVDLEALQELLVPPTRLVSILWGQSEVGTLQPITSIGRLCRQAGVLLHVDAVQVVGHQPVDFSELPVDLLSCAAHKLQGPRGVGALLVRHGLELEPLIGGAQEGGVVAAPSPWPWWPDSRRPWSWPGSALRPMAVRTRSGPSGTGCWRGCWPSTGCASAGRHPQIPVDACPITSACWCLVRTADRCQDAGSCANCPGGATPSAAGRPAPVAGPRAPVPCCLPWATAPRRPPAACESAWDPGSARPIWPACRRPWRRRSAVSPQRLGRVRSDLPNADAARRSAHRRSRSP